MRKSMLSLFSLLLVLSMLFTACSGSAPTEEPVDAPTEEAQTSSETVEITIWTMPNGADPQGSIDAEIAEFNKQFPNIKVTAEIVGWGDAYGRIQTAVQGGEGPCLTQMGTTWVPTFGTMGGMKEYADGEIDELGGVDNFVAASWETAGVSGKTVAIPWFADVRAIAYRKDVFEQAGVDTNEAFKDLDSFVAALEAIKDAGLTTEDGLEIAPFHHPGRNDWNVWQNASMWIWAYGGELLNADGSEAVFNSPEAVAGIKMYNSLYGMGLTPEDTLELNSSQTDSRFGEGTTASYITGPWIISSARDMENSGWTETAAKNLAFAEFPAGPGGQYTFVGGSNLAMMDSCAHQEEAFEFVKFLLGKESQIRYANAIGMLPVTQEAQSDSSFTEDELFSVFIDASAKGKTSMNIPAWGQVENNLQVALQDLWEDVAIAGIGSSVDDATIQARLDEAVETVNSLLGAPVESESESAEEPAEEESLSGDVVLWIMPNGADPQGAIDAEIAEFNKLYPDVNVTAEVVGWGDAYGRIQTAVQGGEGPCLTQMGTTWVPTFGTMGGMKEYEDAEINEFGGVDNFVAASWETAGVSDKTVAIPWFADVRAIAYRKDVFEQAGVDTDEAFKDLDSFVAALEAIKDAGLTTEDGLEIAPFHHPGRNDWNVWQNASMWIWAYGGELLSADGSEAVFNSPEAVAGIKMYNSLYGMGLTPEDTLELNSSQTDARFGEGTTASYITGPWIISSARDMENSGWTETAAENLAFAEFPAGPGGQYTFVGGSNLAMMNSCDNQEAAFAFMKFLLGKESQIRYANAIGMLPVTQEAQSDSSFTEDELFSVFIDASAKGKTSMNIPAWGQVENNLQVALQDLWEDVAIAGIGSSVDDATIQSRLDEAVETVNSLIE